MNADAIIFDKDGTLIDFDTFWVTVSVKAIEDILKKLGREDICVSEILSAFGIHAGVIDIEGVLCKGTYEQMGQILYNILLLLEFKFSAVYCSVQNRIKFLR